MSELALNAAQSASSIHTADRKDWTSVTGAANRRMHCSTHGYTHVCTLTLQTQALLCSPLKPLLLTVSSKFLQLDSCLIYELFISHNRDNTAVDVRATWLPHQRACEELQMNWAKGICCRLKTIPYPGEPPYTGEQKVFLGQESCRCVQEERRKLSAENTRETFSLIKPQPHPPVWGLTCTGFLGHPWRVTERSSCILRGVQEFDNFSPADSQW